MQGVKLSDQLGAMAIIDELYQKQQLLLEHLDRDTLRKDLELKIREHYQASGLTVDDKIIDQGINLWFDKRLCFNAPPRSWLQEVLIFCYIKRNQWLWIVGVLFLTLLCMVYITVKYDSQLKNRVVVAYRHILASQQSLTDLQNEFSRLEQQPINYTQVPVKKLIKSLNDQLDHTIIPPVAKPEFNDTPDAAGLTKQFKELKQLDLSIHEKLNSLTQQITALQTLIEGDHKLAQLINSEAFAQARKRYPVLELSVNSLIDGLNRGQMTLDLSRIEKLYGSVERATDLETTMQVDWEQLKMLDVPDGDLTPVITLQTALRSDLKKLNFANVDHYSKMIAYYIRQAQIKLRLIIVDEDRYKTGVERTNNKDGQSWYLIVRPVSSTGASERIWVTSTETGRVKFANMFGLQVTQQLFNDIKQQKATNGRVKTIELCHKPIGRLIFLCPITVESGLILEW